MLLSIFRISGHSMEPSLRNGSIVFISSLPFLFREPRINDIVAFTDHSSKKIFIKRIASQRLVRLWRKKQKGKQYYLAGDNKRDSLDSRKMGWVDRNAIIGKVIANF